MRRATIQRDTKETQIAGVLEASKAAAATRSPPASASSTTCWSCSPNTAASISSSHAEGDLDVDQHHTVEDVGIVLGQLFAKALGDRKGINRAGYFVLPMDETLAVVALDLGGRPALVYKDLVKVRLVGDLQTELVEDFFGGFVNHAGANLHAKVLYGRSSHHKIEAIFKCFARAMKYACSQGRAAEGPVAVHQGAAMIAIFDYGAGNLRSVAEHAGRIGCEYAWCATPPACARASKIILPGVGHFGQMMRALDALDVREALIERIRAGVPFLGICLGLQALFEASEKPRKSAAWAFSRARCAAFPPARACRTWAGTSSTRAPRSQLLRGLARAPVRLLRAQLLRAR